MKTREMAIILALISLSCGHTCPASPYSPYQSDMERFIEQTRIDNIEYAAREALRSAQSSADANNRRLKQEQELAHERRLLENAFLDWLLTEAVERAVNRKVNVLSAILKQNTISQFRSSITGKIDSFDAETRTASIMMRIDRIVDGKPSTDAILSEGIPVFVPAGASVTVSPGDSCLVYFFNPDMDANLAMLRQRGERESSKVFAIIASHPDDAKGGNPTGASVASAGDVRMTPWVSANEVAELRREVDKLRSEVDKLLRDTTKHHRIFKNVIFTLRGYFRENTPKFQTREEFDSYWSQLNEINAEK